MVILELFADVYVSLDCRRAESVSDLCTGPVIDADGAVVRPRGDDDRAREPAIVELVDHQRLESVTERIDIGHPPRPSRHVHGWHCEASVHDQA